MARSIELYAIDTCNLRCRGCAASSPFLRDPNRPQADELRRILGVLSAVMRAEQAKFVGGEPLLNRGLVELVGAARASGMFGRIRVATNGLLLHRAGDDFWDAVDVVEISEYPASRDRLGEDVLSALRERARRHSTALEVNRISTFQEMILDRPHPDPADADRVYAACKEAHEWPCHTIYRDRLYRCSRVHTLDRYLSYAGVEHEPFTEADGMAVEARPDLLERTREYLESPIPLRACRFCLGTSGPAFGHRELSVEEVRSRRSPSLRGVGG